MPSLDIRLAWVTRVKVDDLGSSIEAYINLQPTITALRLCNRFGKGDKAFIVRLPVELVKQVEEILMRHEHAKTREGWAQDYRCYQAICKPADHYTVDQQEEIYHGTFIYDFVESDHETVRPKRKLTKSDLERLNKSLMVGDGGWDEGGWHDKHEENKGKWHERVGQPSKPDRGFFTEHKDLLLKHFGLEAWIAHKQHGVKRSGQWEDGSLYRSTTAYLTLPVSASACKEWELDYVDGGGYRVPTEVGYAFSLADPIKPPRKSRRRFPRAVQSLGLKSLAPKPWLDLVADGGDVTDVESGDEEANEVKGASKGWPYLRLLVINRDETEDHF